MGRQLRWGVIGSGGIARRRTIPEGIVPAANAELIVVYDINTDANTEVAKQFKATPVGSMNEFFKMDIDAVYIATPAVLHAEQVMQCAQAGKHVLCEKPLGMTIEGTERMLDVCRNANVMLGAAFMMRFHSQHQAALQMVTDGKLGRLVYGRAQLSCWYPPIESAWRQDPASGGGGSLMDMGGHCIDLLEMYFGKPKKVACFVNNSVHAYKSEDSAVAMIYFENGAIVTVDTFFCIPDESSKNVLEIYGSQGSIIAKGTIGQGDAGEMTAYLQGGDGDYDAQQARDESAGMNVRPKPVSTYQAEVEEFSSAILEKRRPVNDAQIGLSNQKVLAACYESAQTGTTVKVET
jgi:predicted dehydrogenase